MAIPGVCIDGKKIIILHNYMKSEPLMTPTTFRSLKAILTAFIICLTSLPPSAKKIDMSHLDGNTSLSNARINTVFTDSRGLLWIGTASGLRSFDGYRMRQYREGHSAGQSALNINISDIKEDVLGRLWIKAEGKYRIYNPETGQLIEDADAFLTAKGLSGSVSDVLRDGQKLWLAVDGKGVYRYFPRDVNDRPILNTKYDGVISSLTKSGKQVIAATADGYLLFIDNLSGMIDNTLHIPDGFSKRGTYTSLYGTFADSKGRIWVYYNDYINAFDPKTHKWLTPAMPSREETGMVKRVYEDRKGHLWIARDHKGLGEIIFDGNAFHIEDRNDSDNLLAGNTITCFSQTPDGTLWAGTYKQGLFSYNNSIEKFTTEDFPDVNCALTTPDGAVWLGTDSSGLWHWVPATNARKPIPDPRDSGNPAAITSLAMDSDGTLYIGRFAKGLIKYKDGKFSDVVTHTGLDNSFPWALIFDNDGMLWVGTLGAGLYRINPSSGETTTFNSSTSDLSTDYVTSAMESHDGKLYFGTSYGVSVYDPETRKITSFLNESNIPNPSSRTVNQVFEDSRGLIWIATQSGLKAFDRHNKKIHDVALRDNRTEFPVHGIIEAKDGTIWVAEGANLIKLIVRFDNYGGNFSASPTVYDRLDGVQDSEFNSRSFALLPDGDIIAGGLYGLTRFSPSKMNFNSHKPRVFFTDLYLSGRRVEPGEEIDGNIVLSKGLNQNATIEFSHHPREFTIYFATDNYAIPQKTTFEYRLVGYSDEWQKCAPGENHVSYTNLSPGKYSFEVKAINGDGYASDAPATIEIIVKHPFWLTPWAFVAYALIAALIVYVIVRLVSKRERRRFELKRKEDALRKREEVDQAKFKFFTNVSHDLRTPLTLIVSPLEAMLKESTDEKQTKRLTLMRNNAMKLLTLVNQLLDFRKTEMAGLHLHAAEGDIVEFVKTVSTSFLGLSDRKNINLTFYSSQEKIEFAFDPDKMEKTLMNLLGNAFKFTPPGGRVDVSVESVGGENVRLKVADTGPGISDKDKPHIFERFYQVDDNGQAHPDMGSGIGLSMVSEYVKLHGGTVRVTDNVECGSVFIIDLPMSHLPKPADEAHKTEEKKEVPAETPAKETKKTDEIAKKSRDVRKPVALVVDDNPDITEMIKDGVEKDFEVITASDGAEALEKMNTLTPAIVVADLMMPNVDGMELCKRMKTNRATAQTPLIILTAKHDLNVKVEGLTLGADDYMTKPFNIDVLRLRMKKFVQLTEKGHSRIDPEPGDIKITPLDEKLIDKAVKYVTDNIDKPELSVEEMSSSLGMSRVRLYKKIKQITGKTPIEFIRVIRLKRAAQLLRESQLNVSEIAYRTGFNNPKVFSKYFKEEFGILPSRYQDKEERETNYTI